MCGGPWSGKIAEMAGIGSDKNHPEPLLRHKVSRNVSEAKTEIQHLALLSILHHVMTKKDFLSNFGIAHYRYVNKRRVSC